MLFLSFCPEPSISASGTKDQHPITRVEHTDDTGVQPPCELMLRNKRRSPTASQVGHIIIALILSVLFLNVSGRRSCLNPKRWLSLTKLSFAFTMGHIYHIIYIRMAVAQRLITSWNFLCGVDAFPHTRTCVFQCVSEINHSATPFYLNSFTYNQISPADRWTLDKNRCKRQPSAQQGDRGQSVGTSPPFCGRTPCDHHESCLRVPEVRAAGSFGTFFLHCFCH